MAMRLRSKHPAMRPHAKRVWDVVDEGQTVAVRSSNLRLVEYDNDSRELLVEFVKGPTYRYFDVPERVVENLMTAPSTGVYFHQAIRFSYIYERVAD